VTTEKIWAKKVLKMVNEDLDATVHEKKALDKLYIAKQGEERALKKRKAELEAILSE
jgi:hypothetical protein